MACNRDRWDGRSCPNLLDPAKLHSSQVCLVCGQCLTACESCLSDITWVSDGSRTF